MTTEAGSAELAETAGALVDRLGALRGALHAVDAFHMQHDDFGRRAGDPAATSAPRSTCSTGASTHRLCRRPLRIHHWATDVTVMLGDRFVQHYTNADQASRDDAVDRWRRGELPSVTEEPRLIGKGNSKLRIVRRGLTSEDGSVVLHPMYFEAEHFDPFFGPPDEQTGVHSHHAAHRLFDSRWPTRRTVLGRVERELGLLYVVQTRRSLPGRVSPDGRSPARGRGRRTRGHDPPREDGTGPGPAPVVRRRRASAVRQRACMSRLAR